LFRHWNIPLILVPFSGCSKTFHGHGEWSPLDQFAISNNAASNIGRALVNRVYDVSDHFIIQCNINSIVTGGDRGLTEKARYKNNCKLNWDKVKDNKLSIKNSNRWATLCEGIDACSNEQLLNDSHDGMLSIARECEVLSNPTNEVPVNWHGFGSKKYRRLRYKRRLLFKQWRTMEAPRKGGPVWKEYDEMRLLTLLEKRNSFEKHREKQMIKGAELLHVKNMGTAWKWAKGANCMNTARVVAEDYGPIMGSDGILKCKNNEKLVENLRHFSTVLSDVTGHSKDRDFWRERYPGACNEVLDTNQVIND
jgi:hypothetical protein